MSGDERPIVELSDKELLAQDLKTVDLMARWRKKMTKGENIKVKVLDKGMMPTINIGDIAEVMSVQVTNLKSNNIIFFRQNDTFMVRRIIECIFSGSGQFKVKGDNQSEAEPLVNASQIIGKVVAFERDGQKILLEKTFASAFNDLNTKFNSKFNKGAEGTDNPNLDKAKEVASNIGGKVLEALDTVYRAIVNVFDKIVEKMNRR